MALVLSGLPPDRRLRLQVQEGRSWTTIGRFRSAGDGSGELPPFRVTERGGYLLRIPVASDRFKFLRIQTTGPRWRPEFTTPMM